MASSTMIAGAPVRIVPRNGTTPYVMLMRVDTAVYAISSTSARIGGGTRSVQRTVGSAVAHVAFLLLPLVLFLFYRSGSVRATCATADPTVRWTDRVRRSDASAPIEKKENQ